MSFNVHAATLKFPEFLVNRGHCAPARFRCCDVCEMIKCHSAKPCVTSRVIIPATCQSLPFRRLNQRSKNGTRWNVTLRNEINILNTDLKTKTKTFNCQAQSATGRTFPARVRIKGVAHGSLHRHKQITRDYLFLLLLWCRAAHSWDHIEVMNNCRVNQSFWVHNVQRHAVLLNQSITQAWGCTNSS